MNELSAEYRSQAIKKVTWWGLICNLLLTLCKLLGGWLGHSQAVIADAAHSLSDLLTDIAILVGLKLWNKPSDEQHPYGHGRIEHVVAVFLGVLLAATGVGIAYHAISSYDEAHATTPRVIALIAVIISMVVKESLYHWTIQVGRKVRSPALLANAWHHRSDALSSIPATLGVAIAFMYPELWFIDHIAAVVVAFFILQVAAKIAFPSLGKLVDAAPPPELRDEILKAAKAVKGVKSAHAMRTRYIGADIAVDLHIEVDGDITVREGHDIAEEATDCLINKFSEVVDVVVHVEPVGDVTQRIPRNKKTLD
ncbi:MAG: cation transporter [Planctomycetes bacterium]|nr:cation transporter [Planctomycetota bacterium]